MKRIFIGLRGTAVLGHGPDFIYAVEAASRPVLMVDEAAGPPMKQVAKTNLITSATGRTIGCSMGSTTLPMRKRFRSWSRCLSSPAVVSREALRNIRVWLQDGADDMGTWPLQNIEMANTLKRRGYDLHFSFGAGTHNSSQGSAQHGSEYSGGLRPSGWHSVPWKWGSGMSAATDSEGRSAIDGLKQIAASLAAAQLQDGTIVGLGSGSTARLAVAAIGQRVQAGLRIIGIPTSEQTADQARALGIPLSTLGEYSKIDVTIDGADEVELGTLNLIKGGGGNHLREKIVATASARLLIVVDETKLVPALGTRARVPVEVAQFGWQATARKLTELKSNPSLRLHRGEPFVTDGQNYILDCAFEPFESAGDLQRELDSVVGVVEHGLFIGLTSQVLVGTREGVKWLFRGDSQ